MNFEKIRHLISLEMNERGTFEHIGDEVSQNLIFVLGGSNELFYYRDEEQVFHDTCTTAEKGYGSENESLKTPLGLHQVQDIIGKGAHPRAKIDRRILYPEEIIQKPKIGELVFPIVGRVMLLEGLEPPLNNNALDRSVYIHGTSHDWFWKQVDEETGKINLKRSLGCVCLRPKKIAELVDTKIGNTLPYVYISEKDEL